jgi:hypothetical protein
MKKRFTSGRISLGEIQVSKIFWQIAAISGTQQISSRQLKERQRPSRSLKMANECLAEKKVMKTYLL